MPYIKQIKRDAIDPGLIDALPFIKDCGDLNYAITRLCDMYLCNYGEERYKHYNEVIGVMTCALLEMYRRKPAVYEDVKRYENGDVYNFIDQLEE